MSRVVFVWLLASVACSGRTLRTSDAADDPVPMSSASAAPAVDAPDPAPNDAADSVDAHHAPPATTSASGVNPTAPP